MKLWNVKLWRVGLSSVGIWSVELWSLWSVELDCGVWSLSVVLQSCGV